MKKPVIEKDVLQIDRLIKRVLGYDASKSIERMGGMTNHTYKVTTNTKKAYVVRIPGEGTETMICRRDEEISTRLACRLGIDAELLFFGDDGEKVAEFIEDAVTLNNESMKCPHTIHDIARVLNKLHSCKEDTGVIFDVFEMANTYESIIKKYNVEMYPDYTEIKKRIMNIKAQIDEVNKVSVVPCHNDPLCENWVYGKDKLYLIDWEYAGMNDSMWDLADISIEADYDKEQDEYLLVEYFGHKPSELDKMRFMANKLYVDYLWTLWGKARVPFDGEEMEVYALGRYNRLKDNLKSIVSC